MNKSALLSWLIVGVFLLLPASGVYGLVDFSAFKSAPKVTAQVTSSGGSFFKPLEPRSSFRGSVKTFSIKSIASAKTEKRILVAKKSVKFEEFQGSTSSLVFPVSGEISSLFGYRPNPFRRSMRKFHTGLDIRAPTGTSIYASAPGRVIFTGWRSGYGLMVEVDHGKGLHTVYAHCSKISTKAGAVISTGSLVGCVGRTGVTTGSHLHFEVRQGGLVMNPLNYLKRSNLS